MMILRGPIPLAYLESTLTNLEAARQLIGYADSIKAPQVIEDLENHIHLTKFLIDRESKRTC